MVIKRTIRKYIFGRQEHTYKQIPIDWLINILYKIHNIYVQPSLEQCAEKNKDKEDCKNWLEQERTKILAILMKFYSTITAALIWNSHNQGSVLANVRNTGHFYLGT